jgi:2-C-methyl-D-erythritol 2,4-cyclodiphosphate synthase
MKSLRVGQGYDSHRFEEGRELWLGGILIPHDRGLAGHSDGDVIIHSLCDALLGSAGLPDIGNQFPDTSKEYEGIDSKILLSKTLELFTASGFKFCNADITVCAEEPYLADYIPLMRECLGGLLGCEARDISIKAKTNEGMGFVGRSEGIVVYSVVLVSIEDDGDFIFPDRNSPPVGESFYGRNGNGFLRYSYNFHPEWRFPNFGVMPTVVREEFVPIGDSFYEGEGNGFLRGSYNFYPDGKPLYPDVASIPVYETAYDRGEDDVVSYEDFSGSEEMDLLWEKAFAISYRDVYLHERKPVPEGERHSSWTECSEPLEGYSLPFRELPSHIKTDVFNWTDCIEREEEEILPPYEDCLVG